MLAALATSRLLSMSAAHCTFALSAFNNRLSTLHNSRCRRQHITTQRVHAHPDKQHHSTNPSSLSLPTVLSKVRDAIRGNSPLDRASNSNAMAFGMGQHMGCDVSWTFIWRPDGAFYEEIRSRHLTYKWGFDGGQDSPCWEVDPSGVSKVLERDDREASLISALIKSGNWLIPAVADKWLDIELEDQQALAAAAGRRSAASGQDQQLVAQYMPHVNMPPVATLVQHTSAAVAAAAQPELAASQLLQRQDERLEQQLHDQQQQQQLTSMEGLQDPQQQQQQQHDDLDQLMMSDSSRSYTYVAVKIKGGRMLARVAIDSSSWQPRGFSHPLCSDTERWMYGGWINWAKVTTVNNTAAAAGCNNGNGGSSSSSSTTTPDVYYPQVVLHHLHQDSTHQYNTHGVVVRGTDIHRAYQIPAMPAVPIDAQYLQRYSERVPIWQTQGGHILAECFINGRRAGWMVLDTGASGLVIEPAVADHFGLPKFGDLKIAGVGGKVGTRFRRVSQLRIGPLLLSDPVMMEMKVSKLVSSFHDRVVGIAGFDVFRRCRITLPCHRTRMNLIKATGQSGKVQPYVGSLPTPADINGSSSSSLAAAAAAAAEANVRWWELDQYQMVQQETAEAVHAAESGHTAAPRRSSNAATTTAAAAVTSTAAVDQQQQQGLRRRRRRRSSSSSRGVLQAVATVAESAQLEPMQQQSLQQQQQQQHDLGILAHVPAVPRKYYFYQNLLIELLLQRPDTDGLKDGYIWQDIVMIASLPHIELEFVVPSTNKRHRSLFLLDTGAAGSEMMFHSRAAKELQLLTDDKKHPTRFVTGVNGGGGSGTPVVVQQGTLPEVIIRGQYGKHPNLTAAIAVTNVEALYSRVGGLDISLYAAGMVCVDLLHRMQVVIDYTNKRVGWRVPPGEHLRDMA